MNLVVEEVPNLQRCTKEYQVEKSGEIIAMLMNSGE